MSVTSPLFPLAVVQNFFLDVLGDLKFAQVGGTGSTKVVDRDVGQIRRFPDLDDALFEEDAPDMVIGEDVGLEYVYVAMAS